jgi:ribosomal-protein-alanine N-acetyltransferase
MSILVETERLVLRELVAEDALSMFEMDSDPEVQRYLGNKPLVSLTQSQEQIKFIQQQYHDNGIGRWAVIDKQTGEFVGWAKANNRTAPSENELLRLRLSLS